MNTMRLIAFVCFLAQSAHNVQGTKHKHHFLVSSSHLYVTRLQYRGGGGGGNKKQNKTKDSDCPIFVVYFQRLRVARDFTAKGFRLFYTFGIENKEGLGVGGGGRKDYSGVVLNYDRRVFFYRCIFSFLSQPLFLSVSVTHSATFHIGIAPVCCSFFFWLDIVNN